MTFLEWLTSRYGSAASEMPNMRQLEAWEAGRRDLTNEVEPVCSLAADLAQTLQKAFTEGSWVGVPEVIARARELGVLPKR